MSGNRGRIEVLRERSFAEMRRLDATEKALLALNDRVAVLEGAEEVQATAQAYIDLVRKLAALEPATGPAFSYQNNLIKVMQLCKNRPQSPAPIIS